MSEYKRLKLHTDRTHYDKTLINFNENSTCQAAQIEWLQNGFVRDAVTKLSESVDLQPGEELRTLGIGSSEGELECELLTSLLQKFPRISNHVIEPSENLLDQYKRRIQNDALQRVSFQWNMETIQSFRRNRDETGTNGSTAKFHFISALNSLYYVDDLGEWLDYLYDLLEDGGMLMVILTSDTSGQAHLNNEYLLHDWWYRTGPTSSSPSDPDNNGLNHGATEDHFKKRGILHQNLVIPIQCDITKCFDMTNPTPESDLLLDFFSNIINFRQNVENKVFKQFLDILGSAECSDHDNGKVLLNYDYGVTVATKK